MSGTRLIDLPPLAEVTDATEFVSANAGSGTVTGAQVKDYVLGGLGDDGDIQEIQSQIEALSADLAAKIAELNEIGLTVGGHTGQLASQSSAIQTLEATAVSAEALTALETTVTDLATGQEVISNTVQDLQQTTTTQAQSLQSLNTTVGGYSATITDLAQTTATMGARRTVMVDVNGVVAGYSLSNTGTVEDTRFIVQANQFRLVQNANGVGGTIPFEVVDGVTRIANATIGVATIGTLNLAGSAATQLEGARDLSTFTGNGVGQTSQIFGFTLPQDADFTIMWNAQLTGGPTDQVRVEMFLDGFSEQVRIQNGTGSITMIVNASKPAGFHQVQIGFFSAVALTITDQNVTVVSRWR